MHSAHGWLHNVRHTLLVREGGRKGGVQDLGGGHMEMLCQYEQGVVLGFKNSLLRWQCRTSLSGRGLMWKGGTCSRHRKVAGVALREKKEWEKEKMARHQSVQAATLAGEGRSLRVITLLQYLCSITSGQARGAPPC